MKRIIRLLPKRFRWVPHNVFAHPFAEILALLGLERLSRLVHDSTLPEDV